MTEFFGGGAPNSDLPTTQFVKTAIASNMAEADAAIKKAYQHITDISNRYTAIQNDAPLSWDPDVSIGANVTTSWEVLPITTLIEDGEPIAIIEAPTFESELTAISAADATIASAMTDFHIDIPANVREPTFDDSFDFTIEDARAPDKADLPGESDALQEAPVVDWPSFMGTINNLVVTLEPTDFKLAETDGYLDEDARLDYLEADVERLVAGAYTTQLSEDVKTNLSRVLDGSVIISDAYWESLWDNVSNDIARLQAGELRNARNRGAPSYWGLPTEAVLAASRAIQDEGSRKLQQVRFEQAKLQAEMAQKDFWAAVEKALAYEQQWLDFHNAVAARSFALAEKSTELTIRVHNANVALYNARLEKAKFDQSQNQYKILNALKSYETELKEMETKIERDKQIVSRWITGWNAYQIENQAHQGANAEKIKWWATQADSHTKYLGVQMDATKIDLSYYAALLSRLDTVTKAMTMMTNAELDARKTQVVIDTLALDARMKRNMFELEKNKLTQAAEEVKAKLDIMQSQWLGEQGNSLLQNMAQLAVGLAQALVTVSDVNLGASASLGYSYGTTNSVNAENVQNKYW